MFRDASFRKPDWASRENAGALEAIHIRRQDLRFKPSASPLLLLPASAKAGKPERSYNVDVIFSLHCFTRAIEGNKEAEPGLVYADDREPRIFDFQRYEFSMRLPEILETLAQRKCYHTGKGNFFTVDVIDETGLVTEYDVFFAASRSSRKGRLNLFVQSAYVRDALHGTNRPQKKPIGLHVILFNILNHKPIRVPPN